MTLKSLLCCVDGCWVKDDPFGFMLESADRVCHENSKKKFASIPAETSIEI